MSVVGFDFGTRNCVVAVAQRGGIDVIANEVSNRLTPCMAGFSEKERFLGEAALTQWLRNIRNTVTDVKRLIGRKFNEEQVQREIPRLHYKLKEIENGNIGIQVMYRNDSTTFTPEQVAGMILHKLKSITEAATNAKMKDVVIAVPGYWTDVQRRAMIDAAVIAGLNPLRIFNELTATAVSYGIYKLDLPETEPIKTMIIDMGESSLSVGIFAFKKGEMKVLATAYDPNLGGRDFDDILVKHFAAEFKEKYKIDVYTNQKAMVRMQTTCEKVKKVLSSNSESPINLDSLMEDKDVRGMMDRKTYEQLCADLMERLAAPIQRALADAKLRQEDLTTVEITGGATRLYCVQRKLGEIVGRELGKTINSEESVARGCALMCAMLSPVFKVREYKVEDINPFPIRITWKSVGEGAIEDDSAIIFPRGNVIPSPKMLNLGRADGYEIVASYEPDPLLPPGHPSVIGKFNIGGVPATSNASKVKVKVKLDINSVFSVDNAQLHETLVEEGATATEGAAPATEGENATTSPTPGKDEKKEKVKVRRADCSVVANTTGGLHPRELQLAIDEENRMTSADVLAQETADRKNAVESYVYNIRSKVSGELSPFVVEDDKQRLLRLLDDTENWLYGDGEDVTKDVYQGKLDQMMALGEPIVFRHREAEERPIAARALLATLNQWRTEALTPGDKYDHIDQAEKQKVVDECNHAEAWLNEGLQNQNAQPKTANPVFLSKDIYHRRENLEKNSRTVLSKPKPKPKVEPPKTDANAQQPPPQPQQQQPPQSPPQPEGNAEQQQQQQPQQEKMDLD